MFMFLRCFNEGKQLRVFLFVSFPGKCSPSKVGSTLIFKEPNKNCSRRYFNVLLISFKENKA